MATMVSPAATPKATVERNPTGPPSRGAGLATAGGLAALALWSTTFALARSLSEQVGPLTSGAAVYLVGGVFCLTRLWWTKTSLRWFLRLPRNYVVGCGFLFVLYTVSIYAAVGLARNREQLLEIALINYLWPAATILLSLPLLKQRATLWLWPGTVLALTGVFLVMTQGVQVSWRAFAEHILDNPAACLLALVAALSWAFYSNLTRRWSEPGSDGAVTLFMPMTGLVLLAMRFLVVESTAWNRRAGTEAIVLGLVTAVAYGLWDAALRRGNLPLVVACSYFTPLLSTVVSCVYLGVSAGPQLWTGCAVLVTGSILSWVAVTKKPGSSVRG
jgi:drug/metabolite transporter (DMT)-like permease